MNFFTKPPSPDTWSRWCVKDDEMEENGLPGRENETPAGPRGPAGLGAAGYSELMKAMSWFFWLVLRLM